MKKMKTYISPTIIAVELQHKAGVLQDVSPINGVTTNLSDEDTFHYGGEGDGPIRVKESNLWDEVW